MAKLLDARTSQNASFQSSLGTATSTTPVLFGQVGLNIVNPGGVLRVQFTATATISFPASLETATTVIIRVVRGALITDPLVYSGVLSVAATGPGAPTIIPFTVTGSDLNVPTPASGLLVYSAFISANNTLATRFGPESFNAAAYSDF